MKFRPIALIIIALLITVAASAQSAKAKRAKQYMKDIAYRPAIVLLNQILEKEDNPDAKIMIAECYRKVNDWENAEFWYAQVVRQTNVEPVHKLYYG
jgi:thioredoxin-like negative regulator of GroEL